MRNHYCAKLASMLKKNMSSIEDATTMDGDHNAYKECTQASRTGGEQKNNVQASRTGGEQKITYKIMALWL